MKQGLIGLICILFLPVIVTAQMKVVTGIVKDNSTKEGLPFASIFVPNTLVGTMTNVDGEFELKMKEGRDTIQISYMGYLDETLVIPEDGSAIEILLKPWGIDLQEVIVSPEEPLFYIRKAIENYPNTVPTSPFETTAFYAEKSAIANDQTNAYKLDEAVFKTYYNDITVDSIHTTNQLLLHRPTKVGEMETMLERNKRIAKMEARHNKRDTRRVKKMKKKKTADGTTTTTISQDSTTIAKDSTATNTGNTISVGGFTGEGPGGLLEVAEDIMKSSFLKEEYFKKFKFTFGEPTYYKSRKLMVIHFKNKKKVEYAFYDGTIYLDYEDLSIVSLKYNERGKLPFLLNVLIKSIVGFTISGLEKDVVINKQMLGDFWYPKELRTDFTLTLKQAGEYENIVGSQLLNIYNTNITDPAAIDEIKDYDPEKPYEEQIFNDIELDWNDVNVVKLN